MPQLSLLEKLLLKLAVPKLKSTQWAARWLPKIAAAAVVASTILGALGHMEQAKAINDLLKAFGLNADAGYGALGLAIVAAYGLSVQTVVNPILKWRGQAPIRVPTIQTLEEHAYFNALVDYLQPKTQEDLLQAKTVATKQTLTVGKAWRQIMANGIETDPTKAFILARRQVEGKKGTLIPPIISPTV